MTSAIPERPTVIDATVFSNLAYLGHVDRLRILVRPVTPKAVRDELVAGSELYPFLTDATTALSTEIQVVEMDEGSRVVFEQLRDRLDRGEAECLAIAETHDGLLVTDDGAARQLARDRDIRVTGTIGVLIELVDDDVIDEDTADAWLERLIDETDYRVPSRDFSDYL